MTPETMKIGGRYNWKNQPERLVYLGPQQYHNDRRCWHQFDKVDEPRRVWCEVLDSELPMIEETPPLGVVGEENHG